MKSEEQALNKQNSSKALGRFLIILTGLLWGLAGLCVKSTKWGSMPIIGVRSVISFFMLAAFKKSFKMKFNKANVWAAIMMSVTGILYITAITLTTAGTAIVLQYLAPILVLLYAIVIKKRKAKSIEIILTIVVFVGVALSFLDTLDFTHILGNIIALLSGFAFAAQIILMSDEKCDSVDCSMISNIFSFIIAIPFIILMPSLITFDLKSIIWVLILSVFQYGLANIIFAVGVKKIDDVETSLFLCIEPIFNPIPVAIFCGEMMGPLAIAGMIVVIAAMIVYALIPWFEKRAKLLP